MKIAVYTCVTGSYEEIKVPSILDSRIDYYCFTDKINLNESSWIYKKIELPGLNKRDQNRYIKMHPHRYFSEYDATVYLDGSIQIVGDIYELVIEAMARDELIFAYDHPQRNCIYQEAAACSHFCHDWIWTITALMRRYNHEDYPLNNGLFEAGVLIRKNKLPMIALMDEWWNEYHSGPKRDQLSLPVVAWRHDLLIRSLGKSDPRYTHKYFLFINHPRVVKLKLILRKYINRSVAVLIPYHRLFGLGNRIYWK